MKKKSSKYLGQTMTPSQNDYQRKTESPVTNIERNK